MPLNRFVCLGLSYQTAAVELREGLRLLPAGANGRAGDGHLPAALSELAALSTCHRLELYAVMDGAPADRRPILSALLAANDDQDRQALAGSLYYHHGRAAVVHLCRVAAGLDSMVLGEPQILGQVRDAYLAAVRSGTAGGGLGLLFRTALAAGKRARGETAISSSPAGIGSVALNLAQRQLGDLAGRSAVVVGAGEMAGLALKALRARGVTEIGVANRSRGRAVALTAGWGGRAFGLEELPQALAATDLVIAAVTAPRPILDAAGLEPVMAARDGRPLLLIDLGVPRNVDPAVRHLPAVRLFDVDDLREGLDEALATRRQAVPAVEALIDEEVAALEARLPRLAVEPTIAGWRQKAEAIRRRELERTLRHLGEVDPQTLARLDHLSRSLVNKLLHEPTMRLKESAARDESAAYLTAVRDLFGLEQGEDG